MTVPDRLLIWVDWPAGSRPPKTGAAGIDHSQPLGTSLHISLPNQS